MFLFNHIKSNKKKWAKQQPHRKGEISFGKSGLSGSWKPVKNCDKSSGWDVFLWERVHVGGQVAGNCSAGQKLLLTEASQQYDL